MAIIIYDLIFLTARAQTDVWTRYWRLMVPLGARRADLIFTISGATRSEIITRLGIDAKKIRVFHTGIAGHFRQMHWNLEEEQKLRKELGLPFPFILSVGAHDPRRNVKRLLEAYRDLTSRRTIDHKLVVIGPKTPFFAEVWRHTQNLGLTDKILYVDHVPNERLYLYYNLADLYVYPSLEEGFGLTPLEAMACGCPVITSTVSSLPEVVGDAALLVDPVNTESLGLAIERMLFERKEREEWVRRGIGRARQCSWKRGVEDILQGCEEILSER
jgi:glycosyltransferase involved in cell wall biosynthesis